MKVLRQACFLILIGLLVSDVGEAQSEHSGVGALPYADATGTGYSFRVWAPNASSIQVVGDFNNWQFNTSLAAEPDGYWSCDVEGAKANQQYKFFLNNNLWRKDPRSRKVTSRENSVLFDPEAYHWQDGAFIRPNKEDLVIYEMHLGSFFDPTPADNEVATFDDAASKLDYLSDLGINCIELMPVARFPGDRSWGYNPIDLFAIENAYGTPEQFQYFVDACHQRGIAVYVDIVHNHYDANNGDCDLWEFDGWYGSGNYGGIYFYQEDGICCTSWGRRPNYGRQGVVDFITDNVKMWFDEYHIDGFRWDSPMNIVAYDESYFNLDGYLMLYDINQMIKDDYSNRFSMGEDQNLSCNFDSEWHDSFHFNIVSQLTPSDDTSRDMWTVANNISSAAGLYRVIYTETHDKVGKLNNDTRLVSKIDPSNPTGYWARKRASLGALLTFTSPGIPLLFMGQEWFEYAAFDDFDPLDWNQADANMRSRLMFKHLIHMRRNLYGNTAGLTGTGHDVYHVNNDSKVIAFHRWNQHGTNDDVVVAANFSVQTWGNYEIEFPAAGTWHVVFNSDWSLYSTNYNNVDIQQVNIPTAGAKGTIKLAPYSAIILSRTPITPFDADQDSLLDSWETVNGLDSSNPADAVLDPDSDGLSNLREFELNTDPQTYSALHLYSSMNIAGTENQWDLHANPMKLTSHYTWQLVRHASTLDLPQLKFAAHHSWSTCWGDADQSLTTLPINGTADPGGNEKPIQILQQTNDVTLRYSFNETNLSYHIEILSEADSDGDEMNDHWEAFYGLSTNDNTDANLDPDNDGFTNLEEYQNGTSPEETTPKNHDYNSMNLAATFNNWSVTQGEMKLFEHYGWEIIQPVWTQSSASLKFVGNNTFDNSWGDQDQWDTNLPINEFGDWQAEDIRVNDALNGVYRFRFNQKSVAYEITELPFVDRDGDNIHDEWEIFHGLSTNTTADAADDPDKDGFTNLEEFEYATNPFMADPKRSSYAFLAVSGTFNGWSTSSNAMQLVDNYLWKHTLTITNTGEISFKFTAEHGWDNNWGDNNHSNMVPISGIAEANGSNIHLNIQYPGDYHIQFNDRTLQFQMSFAPRSDYDTITIPGTFNGWDPTANKMSLVGNYTWELDAFFSHASNVYCKFVADNDWTINWGDNAQADFNLPISDTGDSTGSNIHIEDSLNGKYLFQFNETNNQYSITLLAAADHDSDGMPDDWESRYGLNPTNSSDAHHNSDSDTMSNYEEYLADTDPTDGNSVFEITDIHSENGTIQLQWQGGLNAYQYLMTASPSAPTHWTILYTNTPPTPSSVTITNLMVGQGGWFRLKANRHSE